MSNVNKASALALARERVHGLGQAVGDEFEILPDATREVECGWVFFFNTADFVKTRDPASALAGNGPILVTREGLIQELSSSIPLEAALKELGI
ncbi:MAG: hypothetical protein HY856_14000 [Burkholderiales bacterium]|nr:hypothetical protein [Burkholderiales bacterium]